MKKSTSFKIIIMKVLIIIGLISIPIVSNYSFNQSIQNTIIYTLFGISIIGNFYSPLHFDCTSELELTVDLNNKYPQPIYITKQNGITESINAKFIREKKGGDIKFIEFEVIKLSGLLGHGISKVKPKTSDFQFTLSLFSPRIRKYPINHFSQELQDNLNLSSNSFTIDTLANYGLLHQLRIKLTECICNNNCGEFPLNQGGSICNIKCVHS